MAFLSNLRRVAVPDQQFDIDELLRRQAADKAGQSGMLEPPKDAPRQIAPALPSSQPVNASAPPVELPYEAPVAQRQVVPLDELGKPPAMFNRNNKGRPVSVAVGSNDPVERNMELIREQGDYKAPRSTKDQIFAFLEGGIPGGLKYATDQNTRNRWAVGDDITSEEGQIARELGVQSKQANVEAAKYRPVYQQGMLDARQDAEARQQASADTLNTVREGNLELRQKKAQDEAPIEIDLDGQKFKVPPAVAARLTTQRGEGQKNRAAREKNVKAILDAVAGRQDKQIAATISQLGDPQEMYGAASDLWGQAQEKEKQANAIEVKTEADVATKKQLLEDAAKLKETTVKIQQEARKADRANKSTGGGSHSPNYVAPRVSTTRLKELMQ